jgi:hypothetical protein
VTARGTGAATARWVEPSDRFARESLPQPVATITSETPSTIETTDPLEAGAKDRVRAGSAVMTGRVKSSDAAKPPSDHRPPNGWVSRPAGTDVFPGCTGTL